MLALFPAMIMFPGLAGVASVSLYLMRPHWTGWLNAAGPNAYATGTVIGILAWGLISLPCRRFAVPRGSNPAVYEDLRGEYESLSSRLGALKDLDPTLKSTPSCREATTSLESLAADLGFAGNPEPEPSHQWVLATGYVAAWGRVHRADECMFDLEGPADVIGYATRDDQRLRGARMPKVDELIATVHDAKSALEKSCSAGEAPHDPEQSGCNDAVSRQALRQVRRAINEFRDDRRSGLIRARNNLFATAVYTGLTSYLILGIALLAEVGQSAIQAGVAFYLVGAVVGLFRHLRAASARDTVIEEDYGLSYARLIQLPLFSGIAAVGGVVLTALLPDLVPGTATTQAQDPTLAQVFNLGVNPSYLVVAGVFGLTPTLLISRMQQQAESYKTDLKSSEATEQATVLHPA